MVGHRELSSSASSHACVEHSQDATVVGCRDASSSSAMAALSSGPAHARAVRGGSFSRTGRGPSGWTEAGPGPGAYQRVEQASRATLHSQPAFTFSSSRSARTCVSSCQILSVFLAELNSVMFDGQRLLKIMIQRQGGSTTLCKSYCATIAVIQRVVGMQVLTSTGWSACMCVPSARLLAECLLIAN